MEILELSGSSYDVGFQHGQKLGSAIGIAVDKHRIALEERDRLNLKGLRKRADAIKKHFPELMEEIEGIADGSSLKFEDVVLYNLGVLREACSNIVFLSNNGPMLGHVNDDVSKGEFDVAFHIRLNDGSKIKQIGVAGSVGTSAAVNSSGLAISHACARSAGLVNGEAVLNLLLFRRALIQRCKSCEDAESFVTAQSFRSGADNIICVDKTGSGFVAEKLPDNVTFRYPEMDALYCTGRTVTSEIKKLTGQDDFEQGNEKAKEIRKRERFFDTFIKDKNAKFSLKRMKEILLEGGEGIWNELSNWAAVLLPLEFEFLFTTVVNEDWQTL